MTTVSTPTTEQGPHDLDVVIDFVNTLDVETGVDELHEPTTVPAWLSARGLMGVGATAGQAEQRRALALREALRSLMLANNGGAPDDDALGELEQACDRGSLRAHFGAGGAARLDAEGAGVDAALARLLIPVFDAMNDGTWGGPRRAARTTVTGRSTTARATAPACGATWRCAATARRSARSASAAPVAPRPPAA